MTVSAPPSKPSAIVDQRPDYGVYIVCLASYNNGHHHGAWIDLQEVDCINDLQERIDHILATSPIPDAWEWEIHDHTGLPFCLGHSKWPNLTDLAFYGKTLQEIGDDAKTLEAFRLYCDDRGEIIDADLFREAYSGCYDSSSEFAYDLADDLGLIPEKATWPFSSIDWEDAWRELEIGGDYTAEPASAGGVHIFRVI